MLDYDEKEYEVPELDLDGKEDRVEAVRSYGEGSSLDSYSMKDSDESGIRHVGGDYAAAEYTLMQEYILTSGMEKLAKEDSEKDE
jgi:hypothetical protein